MAIKKISKEEQRRKLMAAIEADKKAAEKAGEMCSIGMLKDFEISNRENYFLTGILGIDGNTNGFKKGTFNVLYGAESSGKSTMALETVAAYQMMYPDDIILYVDTEQTVDDAFLDRIPGINKSNIYFIKDIGMERIFDKVNEYTKEGIVDFVVIDSIDTMVPLKEEEKSLEDSVMMVKANILSRALAKISSSIYQHGITVLMIQQVRTTFAGMIAKTNGRSGGNAAKFYPATVNFLSKISSQNDKQSDEIYGDRIVNQYCKIKNEKSKISEPYKETYTYLNTDRSKKGGVSKMRELIDYAISYGLIEAKGAWCYYTDINTGEVVKVNGKNQLTQKIASEIDLYSTFKFQIYGKILPPELLITKFEDIKVLLEKENQLMKKNKIDYLKVISREDLISDLDRTTFSLQDKNILDIISQEEYDLGTFILKSDEEKDSFIQEIENKNKMKNLDLKPVEETISNEEKEIEE